MPWSISPDVEAVLWDACRRLIPAPHQTGAALRQAVIARSRRFTSERDELDELDGDGATFAIGGPADLAAHALFFTPADAAKVMVPLSELHGRGLLPSGPLRVLDLGAGPGAMTLGLLDYLHRIGRLDPVQVYAVDRDRVALQIFLRATTALAARRSHPLEVRTESSTLAGEAPGEPGFDLILVGSVLNELPATELRPLVAGLLSKLAPRGALIVIEPALRETARALHELRDWVLSEGRAHVFAPCVRAATPCPALADERDWCHEDRPVALPERTAKLAAAVGLRTHGIKLAYLVLRPGDDPLVSDPARAVRVVSRPEKSKGKRTCYVCGADGRMQVRLLKRHRNENTRPFERALRGDVLMWPEGAAVSAEIGPDLALELFAPAQPPGPVGEDDSD
ncbi:small ribosomal subunit Rsm22 family protein [Haliangium sp.]|uniref:small ribosomal subunit Rsm22 family protein n=1 Tax=Haliangium sp. TaxID=2663208 RepID=UPI003D0D8EA4